jgi:hypothetical protein
LGGKIVILLGLRPAPGAFMISQRVALARVGSPGPDAVGVERRARMHAHSLIGVAPKAGLTLECGDVFVVACGHLEKRESRDAGVLAYKGPLLRQAALSVLVKERAHLQAPTAQIRSSLSPAC